MALASFEAKVHFVAGKGGVGKTLFSKAVATLFSHNHKTLLIELSEEETGEERPRMAAITSLKENLFHVRIFPDQALYEYLHLKLPTKRMLDSVLAHNLFRMLCSAMPGLFDLTRLGKIWYHADEINGSQKEIFDKIVVDMPSSGFVNRFFSIASIVSEAVKFGPLAKEAQLINDYMKNPLHARVHVVTLLQELVVNETLELIHQLKKQKRVALGVLAINRALRLTSEKYLHEAMALSEKAPNVKRLVQSFQARIHEESVQKNRLLENESLPPIIIPDQVGEIVETNIVENMVTSMRSNLAS